MDHSGAPPPYDEGFEVEPDTSSRSEIELEEELTDLLSRVYGVGRERIALASGAQNANFLFLSSVLGRWDRAAVENPTYMPIRSVAEALCGVDTVRREGEEAFRPSRGDLEAALKKGARVVALTNLHNPSGAALSDPEMKETLEIAGERGATVLCDEIYREMQYSAPSSPVFHLGENGVATSGLTKLYGLGDLRVGWLIGPEEMCRKVDLLRLYNVYRLPTRSVAVAIAALRRRDWFRLRVLRRAKENLQILEEWLGEEERVRCRLPDGGLMCLLSLPKKVDDLRLGEVLMDYFSTSVCPGRYFGAEGHVRITFSCPPDEFRRGLENVSAALDQIA